MIKYVLILLLSITAQADRVVSQQAGIDIRTAKVVHLDVPIFPETMQKVFREGGDTTKIPGDRVVIINSGGGVVEIGAMLVNNLMREKYTQGNRLICVADQNAHSMAFNLMSFCDIRLATKGTVFLVHRIEAGGDIEGRHTPPNLRKLALDIEDIEAPFTARNALSMHLSLADYLFYSNNETLFTVEDLLRMGYLQGVATIERARK